MHNTKLKQLICAKAKVELKTSSYKSGNYCEGYADAYPIGSGKKIGRKMCYPNGTGAVSREAFYGGKTKAQAVHMALLRLAAKLGVKVADQNAIERENQADFDARTR